MLIGRVCLVTGGPADGVVSRMLTEALARRGIGTDVPGRSDLAIVVRTGDTSPAEPGLPGLNLGWEARHIHIGPQLRPGHTACASCVDRSLKEAGFVTAVPTGDALLRNGCERAAEEAAKIIKGDRGASPPRTMRRVTEDGQEESFLVVPYPDCPDCRWTPGEDPMTAAYEWQMERPVPELIAGLPATRAPSSLNAFDTRIVRRGTSVPLPRPAAWTHHPSAPDLSPAVLAGLLTRTVGRRSARGDRRWAPSAGNRGSVRAWVVTDVPGSPLCFDDSRGDLVAGPGRVLPEEVLRETDLDPAAHVAIVLAAEPHRLLLKYGRFAYRLIHLDAGCAAMQLALVARAHGLRAQFATRWSAAAGDRLGVRYITAVAVLERERHAPHLP